MTDKTSLGDRMKRYEEATRQVLPPRNYSILRVDMRAAHTYLKDSEKPFDSIFVEHMNATAEKLCSEVQGAQFAYTQSDEISVLYTDFENLNTQPWFGGVMSKQVSIGASLASVTFNELEHAYYGPMPKPALFDARVFTLPDAVEVANYFVWRQRDAIRNSINMVARSYMSHKEMQGKNTETLLSYLDAYHDPWEGYHDGLKRGRVTARFVDGDWLTFPAPNFEARSDSWLAEIIPTKPRFDEH